MRMKTANAPTLKRAVKLTLDSDLVSQARAQWDAEIALACEAHAAYLAEYGSLADHVRAQLDEEE